MGLANDTILSGHVGLNLSWSGGDHHHRHFRGSVPVPADNRDWLSKYYDRGKVGATNPAARANTTGAFYGQIMWLNDQMNQAGFPNTAVRWYIVSLIMVESDYMTSNVANTDNNYGGIKWINKPYQHATKGLKADKGYYAHYQNFQQFLQDLKRVLSLNGPAGRPIDATSATAFGDAIRGTGYSENKNYYIPFNRAYNKIKETLEWGKKQDADFLKKYTSGQTKFTYTPGEGVTPNAPFDADRAVKRIFNSKWPWWAYALAGVGGLIIIKKVMD